jgi:hypothetical protein
MYRPASALYPEVTILVEPVKRITLIYGCFDHRSDRLPHTLSYPDQLEHIVKSGKWLLLGALLAAAAGSSAAWAHGHTRFGVVVGVPLAPYYYPAPVYYYPPPVVVERAPTMYIERDPVPPASGYWYWCRNPQGYYPQVQNCPTPWQQVPEPNK